MAQHPGRPSERSFGFVWTAVLVVLGAWPLVSGGHPRIALLIAAAILAAVSVSAPGLLRPFNIAWHRFGLLLHKVVSPIVLGVMFFLVFTPVGAALRLFGKNLLQRRKSEAKTYWLTRSGAESGSMRDQF